MHKVFMHLQENPRAALYRTQCNLHSLLLPKMQKLISTELKGKQDKCRSINEKLNSTRRNSIWIDKVNLNFWSKQFSMQIG